MASENYPIKYAILELKESVDNKEITAGFIISKCYVVKSIIDYKNNDKCRVVHKVVFPYDDIAFYKKALADTLDSIGTRTVPKEDASGEVYPIKVVDKLYDKYEEAIKIKEELNHDLYDYITSISQGDSYEALEEAREAYFNQMAICDVYEQDILDNTQDMIITKSFDTLEEVRVFKSSTIK